MDVRTPAKSVELGWADGAMAVTLLTDYAQPGEEAEIWSIWRDT